MKSISAAIIVLAGLGWYGLGYGVKAASLPQNSFSEASGSTPRSIGIASTAIGLVAWGLTLWREPPTH
jgi:hypothetical protein